MLSFLDVSSLNLGRASSAALFLRPESPTMSFLGSALRTAVYYEAARLFSDLAWFGPEGGLRNPSRGPLW